MGRTNIDIDDELIARVMRQNGLATKREAVDFALRRVAVRPMTREEMLAMEGAGWHGDDEDIWGPDPVTQDIDRHGFGLDGRR